jgi:RNA polymerase sigma-70 factor (ECF subfamily)
MILAAVLNPEMFPATEDEISRLKRGDPEAVAGALARYQNRLYRYLSRIVRDPALAEDLFQQTWLRVMEKISSYRAGRSFEPWLFSVAHNLAIDHLRRKPAGSLDAPGESGVSPLERLVSEGPDPLDRVLEHERAAALAAAMEDLPGIHREVITLRFEEELKLEQIAEVANIPLSTVKSRLRRALQGLRARLELAGAGNQGV